VLLLFVVSDSQLCMNLCVHRVLLLDDTVLIDQIRGTGSLTINLTHSNQPLLLKSCSTGGISLQ
jgi:hypothetical protein